MDEDLVLILSNPFPADKRPLGFAREEHQTDSLLKAKPREKFSSFREPLKKVLISHLDNSHTIQKILLSEENTADLKIIKGKSGRELKDRILEIEKFFRTYIETADDELIETEARRIEKRFFEKTGEPSQIDFLKIKRYYEKLKTFNESMIKIWKEIYTIINSLSLLNDLEKISQALASDCIEPSQRLTRFTELFLMELKNYLKIEHEGISKTTGNFVIQMTYNPYVRYSLAGFFGDTVGIISGDIIHDNENIPENIKQSSIAKNIVLETREHKLNRSSIFSTIMHGSRDWNRTTSYYMELPAQEYERNVELFKKSYHVSLSPETHPKAISSTSAVLRQSIGEDLLEAYINMIYGKLHEISALLITKDFPGLDHPVVFLYHCGPLSFFNMLLSTFQYEHLGEIFYLKKDRTTERTFPEGIMKRELIEWWNDTFKDITGEEADSYILYSRSIEMVKKDYRAHYEEAINIRRRETGKGHVGLEAWMKENQRRIFGIRKYHIFKRFLGDMLFEQ